MQPAKLPDPLVPRTKIKVVGIAQKNFDAEFFQRLLRQSLDRARRAHGHKGRCVHHSVRRVQPAQPRATRASLQDFKESGHPLIVSRENGSDADTDQGKYNIYG